jgi:hypothetical protein
MALSLTPDQDRTIAPVDVVELDGDHLGRPQSKASENHQHGVVAPADRRWCPRGV